MAMKRGKTRRMDVESLARKNYIMELRRTGATYATILQTLRQHPAWMSRLPKSYNARKVWQDCMAAIEHTQTDLSESANVVRQQELDRLDRMLLGIWTRAQTGDDRAIASVLGIMARRARYIPGLETPQTIAPTTPDGTESYKPFGESDVTDEYVHDVAGLLAQYGLYHLGAAADNGTTLAGHTNGTPEPTPE